jgi:hypothetical protein
MKATKSSCQPATWRYCAGTLIEHRHDGEIRIWAPWGATFGCWALDGAWVAPEWPPLGRLGVWHEPAGERDDAWYASRAAITAYWSQVPTLVRLQAAQHGANQWSVLLEAARSK